jgi:crotonobetainyl-CoA:carnitine CoA-transferase CaiB-like acyl-CoA transferase
MLHDTRFADIRSRMANIDALYEAVERELSQRTTLEWLELFEKQDIPASPSYELEALRNDPHLEDVQFFSEFDHDSEGKLVFPRIPLSFSESPGAIRRGPPQLGQDTEAVLRECGHIQRGMK